MKTATNCHKSSSNTPLKIEARAVLIIPTAMPIAAKIPQNLAMSKGCDAALASVVSASVTGVGVIFAVMSFITFASLSAALLLMRSSMAVAIRR